MKNQLKDILLTDGEKVKTWRTATVHMFGYGKLKGRQVKIDLKDKGTYKADTFHVYRKLIKENAKKLLHFVLYCRMDEQGQIIKLRIREAHLSEIQETYAAFHVIQRVSGKQSPSGTNVIKIHGNPDGDLWKPYYWQVDTEEISALKPRDGVNMLGVVEDGILIAKEALVLKEMPPRKQHYEGLKVQQPSKKVAA